MHINGFTRLLLIAVLIAGTSAAVFADTIRLKDGSVIRGQIVGFRDQQFTVLIGGGSRGRRSQITLYMEDVDSIEFDAATATTTTNTGTSTPEPIREQAPPPRTASAEPRLSTNTGTTTPERNTPRPAASTPTTAAEGAFFKINVRVRADNSANGWTNSGLVVRRGQKLRINSTGRVSLGQGRFSTPSGLPRVNDENKLMRGEPTGGLIAVIGDDNDEFIFVGNDTEFEAKRDGVLFLGVNEGNLNDNSGTYDTVVEAEAVSGGGR
ncbi:MAG TPA: hypothetical protein VM943_06100 [Pyrinomonadaceae bacterium]|nr:hypothetical protein [Pyrinomonadaceae bacterium]